MTTQLSNLHHLFMVKHIINNMFLRTNRFYHPNKKYSIFISMLQFLYSLDDFKLVLTGNLMETYYKDNQILSLLKKVIIGVDRSKNVIDLSQNNELEKFMNYCIDRIGDLLNPSHMLDVINKSLAIQTICEYHDKDILAQFINMGLKVNDKMYHIPDYRPLTPPAPKLNMFGFVYEDKLYLNCLRTTDNILGSKLFIRTSTEKVIYVYYENLKIDEIYMTDYVMLRYDNGEVSRIHNIEMYYQIDINNIKYNLLGYFWSDRNILKAQHCMYYDVKTDYIYDSVQNSDINMKEMPLYTRDFFMYKKQD